jgi:zinc protease
MDARRAAATWLLALLTLAGSTDALAQDTPLPAGVSQVQTVQGITEYRLRNGLKVLLAPDVANDRVSVSMTYLVGSRHEGYGEGGMAHLLEHLIFKGTPGTPDPKAEFRKRGFTFNGTTNHDRTNYFATFVSSQESLDWYIGWQADAMVNSFVARQDLNSEMTVVRNEFEIAGNNAFQTLGQRMNAATYNQHNYGKPVIGNRADIERVEISNLLGFYRRYYRPDNAVLTVAGKFDVTPTLRSIAQRLGTLARPDAAMPTTHTLEPVQDGERSVVVRRPATAQMSLLSYRVPGALHADSVALSVLAAALGDVPSGRLHKALVESRLAQSVLANAHAQRESGTVQFGVVFGPDDDPVQRRQLLLDIVENLAREPVRQDEFDRAKNKINKSLDLAFANALAVANGATAMEVMGDWRAVFVSRERMKAVTLDDVNRVARSYLLPSNRVLGHLIPTKEPLRAPDPQPIDVPAYLQGFRLSEEGLASVAFDFGVPSLFEKVSFATTPGGIKTAVLAKPVRGDLITLNINFKFGSLESLQGQDAAASMARAMLTMGTSRMTRQQIQDELVKLGASLNMGFGDTGGGLSLTAKKDTFLAALELALHLLKDSSFPEKEFEEVRAAQVKSLQGRINDRSAQAHNAFARYGNPYPKGDTRYQHTLDEWLHELQSVTRSQAQAFYKRFYGAQNAHLSLLGPVDAQATLALTRSALDPWKAEQAWQRVPHPLVAPKPARLVFDTPDKTNVSISAYHGMPIKGRDFNPEDYAMRLAARIFGGGPGSRLWLRLREKDGLSYSVGAHYGASYYDVAAKLSLDAEVAPAKAGDAEQALREELARSLKDGFSAEEVASFKKQFMADRLRARSGDGWALGFMAARMEYNEPQDSYERSDALIESLNADQVNAAWRKYVSPEQLVWGIFGDQSKLK